MDTFTPGTLIVAPFHEQFGGDFKDPYERSLTRGQYGTVFTKLRRMVVVATYGTHYISLPFYTHDGQGLANVAREDEHVSVKDSRYKGKLDPLSRHEPLVIACMKEGAPVWNKRSMVQLTYPLSRNARHPCAIEGRLSSGSTTRLVKLLRQFI